MIWVVDTSALIRLYIPDGPTPQNLERAVLSAERCEDILFAPELLLAEVGQTIIRKRHDGLLSHEDVRALLEHIQSLPLRLVPHGEIISRACKMSFDLKLTVYDALFLALAEQHDGTLITADQQLKSAAESLGH